MGISWRHGPAPAGPQVHHHRAPGGCHAQIDGMATLQRRQRRHGHRRRVTGAGNHDARGPHQHARSRRRQPADVATAASASPARPAKPYPPAHRLSRTSRRRAGRASTPVTQGRAAHASQVRKPGRQKTDACRNEDGVACSVGTLRMFRIQMLPSRQLRCHPGGDPNGQQQQQRPSSCSATASWQRRGPARCWRCATSPPTPTCA